jgi:hypothetical protein
VKHKEKFQLIFVIEILLGTNAEYTRNFSHEIIRTFYWILFSKTQNGGLTEKKIFKTLLPETSC